MIVDTLSNRRLYDSMAEGIRVGFDYLQAFDAGATADGRHQIDGDRVFALVQSYDTSPATGKQFETHRLHIDIQYIVAGRERMLYLPAATLQVESPFDEAKDVTFYHDPPASSSLLLSRGEFAIFFPEDAHKGGCMAGGREAVRKVVVKVRLGGGSGS